MELISYNRLTELKSEVMNVSSRTGRPVVGEPKTNDVKVRLDDTTHQKLLEYCKDNGTTKAEVIRKAIKQFLGL